MRRKAVLALLGLAAFAALEVYVIVQVAHAIGAMPTVLLLILEAGLGAWVIRHEGARAWHTLRESTAAGSLPGRELTDSAVVMLGGLLLLVPGFVSALVGLLLLAPPTRPVARRVLGGLVSRRLLVIRSSRYARSHRGVHQIYDDGPDPHDE